MKWLFTLAFVGAMAVPVLAQDGVPSDLLRKLERGVNVPNWFWYAKDDSPAGVAAYLTEVDAANIRSSGLTHVRIPIEPGLLWDTAEHGLKKEKMAALRQVIDMLVGAGLVVIVDVHPNTTAWAKIEGKEPDVAELEKFWVELASAMKDTSPSAVAMEILNEPHDIPDHDVWPRIQQRLLTAIRAVLPRHTIVVTGDDWGGIDGLLRLTPYEDKNLVYSFHFYEPMTFTHQGATWGWPPWRHMADVPYPSTVENVKAAAEKIVDKQARDAVTAYGEEIWNAAKLRERLGKAAAWSKEHGAPVYCGEFGVYRKFAPKPNRLIWLRDVTGVLGDFKIGWSRWDYAGGFDLFAGEAGARKIDPEDAEAMGLKP